MSSSADAKRSQGGEPASTFELRQLQHALAVAEHGSFATAAVALHLSQSALSRSVQALERVVGSPMFLRSAQGIVVTDVGQALIRRAREILALAQDMDTQFFRNRSLQGGSLGIGLASPAGEPGVLAATRALATDWPGVRVELRTAFRTDLLPQLRSGQIELLLADPAQLALEPVREIEVEAFQPHTLALFVRQGHPLAGRPATLVEGFVYPSVSMGRIPPALLDGLLRAQAAAAPGGAVLRPFPSAICNSIALLQRVLLGSDAVVSATPTLLRPLVEAGRVVPLLAPPWLRVGFGVARQRSRSPTQPGQVFLAELRRVHARLVAEDEALMARWFDPATGRRR